MVQHRISTDTVSHSCRCKIVTNLAAPYHATNKTTNSFAQVIGPCSPEVLLMQICFQSITLNICMELGEPTYLATYLTHTSDKHQINHSSCNKETVLQKSLFYSIHSASIYLVVPCESIFLHQFIKFFFTPIGLFKRRRLVPTHCPSNVSIHRRTLYPLNVY